MNTNMAGFRWFQNCLRPCALDKSSLSIGRVKEELEAPVCLRVVDSFLVLLTLYGYFLLLLQFAQVNPLIHKSSFRNCRLD